MTVRAAKFGDIQRLYALMREMHVRSIYRDDCDVDEKEAKALLMRSIQRHGGRHDGSTFIYVAESGGVVEGFMIAVLSRLYGIGTKLMAADTHFYVSGRAHGRDAFKLIDTYTAWAESAGNVIQIDLCATDAIGEFWRTERLYLRKGFKPFGVILTKRINRTESVNV